jgi:hypothetical protein
MAELIGYKVTLNATDSISMPRACCRCGEAGTVERKSSVQVSGARKTRSVTLPYCASCSTRAKTIDGARTKLTLAVVGASAALCAIGLIAPFLPLAALILIPVALGTMFAVVMRQRAGDSVEFPNAAWLVGASNKTSTFFVANQDWANKFAAANGTTAAPSRIHDRMALWILALLITAGGGWAMGRAVRPEVYVDNEGLAPLQIWVDGKKSIVAQPMIPDFAKRPTIEVPIGKHRFGWSPLGASAPVSQTEPMKIEFSGDHLYNPDSSACYFLDLSVYGSDKGEGIPNGPVALTELYTFKSVDNWFSENPHSISTHGGGGTRVAIHALKMCKDLREVSCPTPVVKDMMACLSGAYAKDDKDAYERCISHAASSCRAK